MKKTKFILILLLTLISLDISGQVPVRHYHYEELSSDDIKRIDSLRDNIYQDKTEDFVKKISSEQVPIGFLDIDLNDIVDYNIGNGWMLGLGINTNDKVSKAFSVGGFGNYWFKAKEFNYGGDVTFNLLRSKDMRLTIAASHEFERLGNYGFNENESILNPLNYKHHYIVATSLNNSVSADLSTYINKYLKGYVKFEVADKSVFKGQQTFRTSTLDLGLRIAFGERHVITKKGLKTVGNSNPTIWLSYQKNLKGVFGSPYNFDKFGFQFRGKKDFKDFGETSLTIQAGYVNGLAPITELFNLEGTYENKFGVYCAESFNTMRPDEFISDRFTALYFSHNFKNKLIDFKYFHPDIIIVTNIVWGNFQNFRISEYAVPDLVEGQNLRISEYVVPELVEGQNLSISEKGYYESGLVLDNIIEIGYTKIGLAAFYRYGPCSYDDISENIVIKICLEICL